MDGAAILVPRRADHGHRDRLWAHVAHRLDAGGWRIAEGHDVGRHQFRRSTALNRAAALVPDADVLVIYDADTIVAHEQIRSAVAIARATGIVTFGFHRYAALSEEGTRQVLAGYDGSWEPFVAYEFVNSASSCLAVRRDLWDRCGGFDERFRGWGFEDVAASLAFQTMGGGMHRVAGEAWHLWHPPAPHAGHEQSATYVRNQALCEPYRLAMGDPATMAKVLER